MDLYAVVTPEGDVHGLTTVDTRAVSLASLYGEGNYVVKFDASVVALIAVAPKEPEVGPVVPIEPEPEPEPETPVDPPLPEPIITEPENGGVTTDFLTGDPVPIEKGAIDA